MAITIVDNRIVLNQADSTAGWTATDGPTLFTADPSPIEATGCLAMQVSAGIENAYIAITSDNYSTGGSLFVMMADRAEFDTTVNGGIGIIVGDGTNRIAYHVGGSDGTGFRHDVGLVKWASFQIDLANKPANFTTLTGTEANLNEAAITQIGVYFETTAKSVGGADNCFWDIIRFADPGVGIRFHGGTVGTPEGWNSVTIQDRGTGNLQAHYIIRRVGSGVYDIQGNINIGDNVGTNSTYINSDTEVFVFGDRGQSVNNYYRFNCAGNGTGTTDVNFDSCIFNNALDGIMDFSAANVTADVRSSTLIGWTQGILTGGAGNIWTDNIYSDCGQLTTTGTDIRRSTFTGYTGLANTSQLYWNTTTNPSSKIDGSSFTMPTTLTHAIEFPVAMTNQSISIVDCDFIGFNASNNVNDSTFNVLATTGTLTINVSGGSGNTSYRTAGATVTIVNSVTVTLTGMQDLTEVRVYDAATSNPQVELAGIENATDGVSGARTFAFSLSAGTLVDIVLISVQYENQRIDDFTIPSSAGSIPIQQRFDRNYRNPEPPITPPVELITQNADFGGTVGWTVSGPAGITGGQFQKLTAVGVISTATQTIAITNGVSYTVEVDITNTGGGNPIQVTLGGTSGTAYTTTGLKSETIVAGAGSDFVISIAAVATPGAAITSVSVIPL